MMNSNIKTNPEPSIFFLKKSRDNHHSRVTSAFDPHFHFYELPQLPERFCFPVYGEPSSYNGLYVVECPVENLLLEFVKMGFSHSLHVCRKGFGAGKLCRGNQKRFPEREKKFGFLLFEIVDPADYRYNVDGWNRVKYSGYNGGCPLEKKERAFVDMLYHSLGKYPEGVLALARSLSLIHI